MATQKEVNMTQKALFVCLGNICRSPIAEAVFKHLLKERGIEDQWEVDSAGLGGWHSGNSPDSRAREVLKRYKIEYNGRARQVLKCLDTATDIGALLSYINFLNSIEKNLNFI